MPSGGAVDALDGFQVRLPAQHERLVMDREKELEAGITGHPPCLLGSAVAMNPGIVGTHRHDGQVVRVTAPQTSKGIGEGGVAAEQNPMTAGLDGVAVVTAIGVGSHAGAPVIHGKGPDDRGANTRGLIPSQLLHAAVAPHAQQIAGSGGSHDGGAAVLETAQTPDIGVIHVRVREKNEIDSGQLADWDRRLDETTDAQRGWSETDADARAEYP